MKYVRSIAALLLLACAPGAWAQAYPTRPVKIVVGFAPGSATDTLARIVAEAFSRSMGPPFFGENKPGAGGSIGAAQVNDAPPDEYTLVARDPHPFRIRRLI